MCQERDQLILRNETENPVFIVHCMVVKHEASLPHTKANDATLEMLTSLESISTLLDGRDVLKVEFLNFHR